MIRKVAALSLLLIVLAAVPALAWGGTSYNPCVHHPQYEQCTTTTTYQTTTTVEVTTTQPEVTTTTPNETTTTVEQQETTTTTAAPCAEGLIHQPPLCVNPSTTVPDVQVSSTVVTAAPVVEELPFTGLGTSMLAAASSLFLLAGLAVLTLRRRDAD